MVHIKHKTTDFGYTITGCTFDEYSILLDGKEVATLCLDVEDLHTAWSLNWLSDEDSLPGFMGNEHIIASAMMLLLRDFTEDHSFYYESFYTEDGDRCEKELYPLSLT